MELFIFLLFFRKKLTEMISKIIENRTCLESGLLFQGKLMKDGWPIRGLVACELVGWLINGW